MRTDSPSMYNVKKSKTDDDFIIPIYDQQVLNDRIHNNVNNSNNNNSNSNYNNKNMGCQ